MNLVHDPPARGWAVLVLDLPALLQHAGIHERFECVKAIQLGRGLHSSTSQLNLSRVCHKKTPYTPPKTPFTRATQSLRAPPIPYRPLKLS